MARRGGRKWRSWWRRHLTFATIAGLLGAVASALAIYGFFVKPHNDPPPPTYRDQLNQALTGFVKFNEALTRQLTPLQRCRPATSARRSLDDMDRALQQARGAVGNLPDPANDTDRRYADFVDSAFDREDAYLQAVRMYLSRAPMDQTESSALGRSSHELQLAMKPLDRVIGGAYASIGGAKQLKAWYVAKGTVGACTRTTP
jgi:hypothetical protein